MKCEICGERQAVIHIQQIKGSEIINLHLCEKCTGEKGVSNSEEIADFTFSKLLNGLMKGPVEAESEKKICLSCGKNIEDFRKNGKIGCPECVKVFSDEIISFFKNISGFTHHKGKYPSEIIEEKALLAGNKMLQDKLDAAVKNEDYETAAILRDRIKELEEVSEGGNG